MAYFGWKSAKCYVIVTWCCIQNSPALFISSSIQVWRSSSICWGWTFMHTIVIDPAPIQKTVVIRSTWISSPRLRSHSCLRCTFWSKEWSCSASSAAAHLPLQRFRSNWSLSQWQQLLLRTSERIFPPELHVVHSEIALLQHSLDCKEPLPYLEPS